MRMLVVMAILFAAGCSAQAMHDPVSAAMAPPVAASATMSRLDGTEWRFMEVDGAAVPPAVTATMLIQGTHVSGRAGCNTYGASYRVAADGSASFSQVLSTKMACLEPAGAMQVEHRVFSTLPGVARIELRDGRLALLDASDRAVARLEAVQQP